VAVALKLVVPPEVVGVLAGYKGEVAVDILELLTMVHG
jgi:hypothetical protein